MIQSPARDEFGAFCDLACLARTSGHNGCPTRRGAAGGEVMKNSRPPPDICPHCGADVPPRARSCPACGSSSETGWSEAAAASGLELPDDNFDYQDFVNREFNPSRVLPRGQTKFWWMVGLLLLLAFIVFSLWATWHAVFANR